jgi:hypothetical protein
MFGPKTQVQETLQQYKQRSVSITYERMCPVCKKRIGNSVIAVYPTNQVVHYACMQDNPLAAASRESLVSQRGPTPT